MQFRLRNIFVSIGLISLVLATLTATYWQLSLVWLAVLATIAITVQAWRVYRKMEDASNLAWFIVCIVPGAFMGGLLGIILGLTCSSYTGWFPGYPQWFFAGGATVIALGVRWPRLVRVMAALLQCLPTAG